MNKMLQIYVNMTGKIKGRKLGHLGYLIVTLPHPIGEKCGRGTMSH